MSETVVQEQGATATGNDNQPPSSSSRVNHAELFISLKETMPTETTGKPFYDSPEPNDQYAQSWDDPEFNIEHDAQNGDNPETDVEDKGGTTSSIPVAVEEVGGSSALVTGSSCWSPGMGIETFHFSLCREWKLSEFVGPQWTLSQAIAPDTFQRFTVPFPHQ